MTWQDELRRLDEELASGRLSAEEYRSLRDALLSSQGAGGDPPSDSSTPADESADAGTVRSAAAPASPFPPPFRWEEGADSTHLMRRVPEGGEASAEQTQVVPGSDAGRTQVVPGSDAGRTQVVPGGRRPGPPPGPGMPGPSQGMPGPSQGMPGQGMPGHGMPGPGAQPPFQGHPNPVGYAAPAWRQPDSQPPWASMDLPPSTGLPPSWTQQGPEFEAEPGRSAWRVVGVVVAVVLLIGAGVGAYLYFKPTLGSQGNDPTAQQTTAQPTTPQPTTTVPPGPPIADLPGVAADMSKVRTFTDVTRINYLTEQEIAAYQQGGAGEAKIAVATDGDVRIIVLVTQESAPAAAATARNALADLQLRFKMKALDTQPHVLAASIDSTDGGPLRRAHYASERYVVRIQVQGKDKAKVNQLFTEVLGGQLDELPANA